MEGHGSELIEALRPFLGNEVDLLTAQEGFVGVQQGHELVQGLCDHGSVTHLFLHPTASVVSQFVFVCCSRALLFPAVSTQVLCTAQVLCTVHCNQHDMLVL